MLTVSGDCEEAVCCRVTSPGSQERERETDRQKDLKCLCLSALRE